MPCKVRCCREFLHIIADCFVVDYAITNHLTPFISMQNHYNLIYREEEREMLPTLKVRLDVKIVLALLLFFSSPHSTCT